MKPSTILRKAREHGSALRETYEPTREGLSSLIEAGETYLRAGRPARAYAYFTAAVSLSGELDVPKSDSEATGAERFFEHEARMHDVYPNFPLARIGRAVAGYVVASRSEDIEEHAWHSYRTIEQLIAFAPDTVAARAGAMARATGAFDR